MQRLYQQMERVAGTSVTVFLTGESGTGKEVVAQTLHELSQRRSRPFLAVNCGAISPHLIESEIFGHEKGSFTGADRQHQGFFERAATGTLFLDEITEMSMELQVKLLRVLETGRFMRVGSTQTLQTDVRVIAATNRCPYEAVASGKLREDLLYRLNVFPIELPPLRERLTDVPLLAQHFMEAISSARARPAIHGIGPDELCAIQLATCASCAMPCSAPMSMEPSRLGGPGMAAPAARGHCPAAGPGASGRPRPAPAASASNAANATYAAGAVHANERAIERASERATAARPRPPSQRMRPPTTPMQSPPTTCPTRSRPPYSCPSA